MSRWLKMVLVVLLPVVLIGGMVLTQSHDLSVRLGLEDRVYTEGMEDQFLPEYDRDEEVRLRMAVRVPAAPIDGPVPELSAGTTVSYRNGTTTLRRQDARAYTARGYGSDSMVLRTRFGAGNRSVFPWPGTYQVTAGLTMGTTSASDSVRFRIR